MKKFLTIIALVLLNLGLICLAVILYYGVTEEIIDRTSIPIYVGIFMLILSFLVLLGLVIFSMIRKFRRLGIGVMALCCSGIIFLLFFMNESLSSPGNYESYRLREAILSDNGCILNIDFNLMANRTKVPQEKCLDVDSVQVRTDKGFFGMPVRANVVRIPECLNYNHNDLDSNSLPKSCESIGYDLAHRRCFSEAILYYTQCIQDDSLEPDCYYHRGLMFVATEKYDKAVDDFLAAALFRYYQLNDTTIEIIKNLKPEFSIKQLLEKIDKRDFNGIDKQMKNLITFSEFANYQSWIMLCMKKLEKSKDG